MNYGGQLRDVLTGLWRSVRGFRGSMQVAPLGDGFWQGRQFRAYKEFTLAAGASLTLRVVASKPFILQAQDLYTEEGSCRAVVRALGTPSGAWSTLSTVNPKFRIGMEPVSTIVLSEGGTYTGGQEREVLRGASATGGATKLSSAGSSLAGWRGLPASTFYITITAGADGCIGIYSIEWEDLD
jgi:hypothetical protein